MLEFLLLFKISDNMAEPVLQIQVCFLHVEMRFLSRPELFGSRTALFILFLSCDFGIQ
jgi:hypothetical protein